MSIYEKKTETISKPKGVSNPVFALNSTINWMRALSISVEVQKTNGDSSKKFYEQVKKRNMENLSVNTILEQLLFALHQCSVLRAFKKVSCKSDVARVGIVSWYYGIYTSASAMLVAKCDLSPEAHSKTAASWDSQIARNKLITHPFDLRIDSLVKETENPERRDDLSMKRFDLAGAPPQTPDEAVAACQAYFSGSVDWERSEQVKKMKSSPDFKKLGVGDFRTKKARELRDKYLDKKTVGFLHQAFRYRGKANYRDACYLGYGKEIEEKLSLYIEDLSSVLDAFVCQAGIYCSRRLGKERWSDFMKELELNRSFSLSPYCIWGVGE